MYIEQLQCMHNIIIILNVYKCSINILLAHLENLSIQFKCCILTVVYFVIDLFINK